jgi:hypothetical protein
MKKYFLIPLFIFGLATTNLTAESTCCPMACEQNTGVYVGAIGGGNWLIVDSERIDSEEEDLPSSKLSMHMKPGFIAGGVIGYKFCPINITSYCNINSFCCMVSPRVEAEVAYRYNRYSHIKVDGEKLKLKGHVHTISYMANFIGDIDLGMPVTPFVGFGLGYADSQARIRVPGFGTVKGHEDHFAYQFIGGVNYALCEKTEISLDYRYLKSIKHCYNNSVCLGIKRFF